MKPFRKQTPVHEFYLLKILRDAPLKDNTELLSEGTISRVLDGRKKGKHKRLKYQWEVIGTECRIPDDFLQTVDVLGYSPETINWTGYSLLTKKSSTFWMAIFEGFIHIFSVLPEKASMIDPRTEEGFEGSTKEALDAFRLLKNMFQQLEEHEDWIILHLGI